MPKRRARTAPDAPSPTTDRGSDAMDVHGFERLKSDILPLLVSSIFDVSRQEWELVGSGAKRSLIGRPAKFS